MERTVAGGGGKRSDDAVLALMVMFGLGSVIGVASGLLSVMLKGVEWLMLGFMETPGVPGPYDVAPWRRIASLVAGAFVAGVVWWLLRTKTVPVPSVAKAVKGEEMPIWQTTVHVLLQIFIVGSGMSIGREVAPREFAAMISQRFCDALHISHRERVEVVACAAAAGLAGVYNAPLAGTFFAVEILLADVSVRTVVLALGMSGVAAYVASFIKGQDVFYDMHLLGASTPSVQLTVFALICGVCSGVLGLAFRKASGWAQRHAAEGSHLIWFMPLAALGTGVVAVWLPQVTGNGRAAAQFAFSMSSSGEQVTKGSRTLFSVSDLALAALVLLVVLLAKMALTVLTIRSGASGGVLQPGIALGSVMGALLGVMAIMLVPGFGSSVSVTACALVGAASLLSTSQQAPLMAVSLVMELTNAPTSYAVPIAVASATAMGVSLWLERTLSSRS